MASPSDLDLRVIATADRLFCDDYLDNVLVECVSDFPSDSILRCVNMICSQRATGERGVGWIFWGRQLFGSDRIRSKDMARMTPEARLSLMKMLLNVVADSTGSQSLDSKPATRGEGFSSTLMLHHRYTVQVIRDFLLINPQGNEQIMDYLMRWITERPGRDLAEILPAAFVSACNSDIQVCAKWGNTAQMST